jgi:hypothetical protein
VMSLITATEYQSLHLFSKPVILGSVLVAIGQETWLRDQDVDALQYRDKVLAEPVGFD